MPSSTTTDIIIVVAAVGFVGTVAGIYYCRNRDSTWPGPRQRSRRSTRRSSSHYPHASHNANGIVHGIPLGNIRVPIPARRNRSPAAQNQPNMRPISPLLPQIPVSPGIFPPVPHYRPDGIHANPPQAQSPQSRQPPVSPPNSPRAPQPPPNVHAPAPALALGAAPALRGILKPPRRRGT